jgi:phosphate transport system permease protein
MQVFSIIAALLVLSMIAFQVGRRRAFTLSSGTPRHLHSLPSYYGFYVALWCGVPALILLAMWLVAEPVVVRHLLIAALPEQTQALPPEKLNLFLNDIRNIASGAFSSQAASAEQRAAADHYNELRHMAFASLVVVMLSIAVAGIAVGWRRVSPKLRARNRVEQAILVFLIVSSTVAVFTTVGIVLSLVFEALRFFEAIPVTDFLFGLSWSPQMAIRADQVGSSGAFGAVPVFAGTLMISAIAMAVAVPIGLFSAIFLAEYAAPRFRAVIKPALEILAGIPTVVYGFFAALTVAPFFRDSGGAFGIPVSSESALAAGVVMGVMIIPFVSSLSDDVITAVPRSLREGSYAMGATQSETIRKVVLAAALPGIVGGVLLAVSRAIGETMIVVMAAGLAANLSANPFQSMTTVTVQIVTLLIGDQEFDSPKTMAAFALGLLLFAVTLCLNILALGIVRRYREQYE